MTPLPDDLAGTMSGLQPRWLLLVILSALGYAVATIGMKLASTQLTAVAVAIIVAGFIAASLAEIALLRRADLGVIYITIIGAETLLVLAFAALIGEGPDLRTLAGAGLVVAGIGLVAK